MPKLYFRSVDILHYADTDIHHGYQLGVRWHIKISPTAHQRPLQISAAQTLLETDRMRDKRRTFSLHNTHTERLIIFQGCTAHHTHPLCVHLMGVGAIHMVQNRPVWTSSSARVVHAK